MANTTKLHIVVMGPTGTGKSSFINCLTDSDTAKVGEDLNSCTKSVKGHDFEVDGRKGTIIDTPGFDDTFKSDTEILIMTSDYLKTTYQCNFRITAIFYLIDITDPRMRGSARRQLELFKKLCGQESLKSVIFITTKWDDISASKAESREQGLLKGHLKEMMDSGARVERHDNTRESAQRIVRAVLGMVPTSTRIQQEMVDEKKGLKDTEAGQSLDQATLKRIEDLEAEIARMQKRSDEISQTTAKQCQIDLENLKRENEKLKNHSPQAESEWTRLAKNVASTLIEAAVKHSLNRALNNNNPQPPAATPTPSTNSMTFDNVGSPSTNEVPASKSLGETIVDIMAGMGEARSKANPMDLIG